MVPSIARAVIVLGIHSNGTDTQPAVITRVWGEGGIDTRDKPVMVNVTVFPDVGEPFAQGSIHLYETEAAARAIHQADAERGILTPYPVAYWPPKV